MGQTVAEWAEQNGQHEGMVSVVLYELKRLSLRSLNGLYMVVGILDNLRDDPTSYVWYEEARALFTENDGKKMHNATKEIIKAWGMTILKEKGLPGA
jgi:hypothetical protein